MLIAEGWAEPLMRAPKHQAKKRVKPPQSGTLNGLFAEADLWEYLLLLHRPTILVVDDEASVLKWLARSLGACGYEVLGAANPDTALALLAGNTVDALILDVRLVGRSGLEILESVRFDTRLAHVPVIILTGISHLTEEEQETIRRHRAYVFFKPEGVEVLVEKLDQLLRA